MNKSYNKKLFQSINNLPEKMKVNPTGRVVIIWFILSGIAIGFLFLLNEISGLILSLMEAQ